MIDCYSPSQIQTVLSRLQLASSVPVLEYAMLLHSVSCPSSRLMHSHSPFSPPSSPSSCSHIPMLASKEAVARVLPEGDQAIARTVFVCPVGMVVLCVNLRELESADSDGEEEYVYRRTVLSAEHDAMIGLVGFQAMCQARSS